MRTYSRLRPQIQINISDMTPPPITSGNHPPWMIFSEFAARNAPSTCKKQGRSPRRAFDNDHPHTKRAAEKNNTEVIAMVSAIAMP